MYRTVAAYPDPLLAHIVRGRLEAEGITAWLADEHSVIMNWDWRLALGGVKVRVATEQFAQARALVRELDGGAFAILADDDATLPACRETWSSRIAYFALFALSLPLPWSRRSMARGTGLT